MAKKIVRICFCLTIIWVISAAFLSTQVRAQENVVQAATQASPLLDPKILGLVIESVIFSVVGLVVLLIGYRVFDMMTPYHLDHQIAEDNNTAAGVAVGGLLIALGLIVAAAIGA